MVISSSGGIIAQRQFVIVTSIQRVWDLLVRIMYQQLPLEKVDIESLDSFKAVLKLKKGFITFPFYVEGKLVDVTLLRSYGCLILLKRGPIRFGIKVTVELRTVDESKVEVSYKAMMKDGNRGIIMWLLRGQIRKFTLNMFNSIGVHLQQLCS